MSRIIKDFKIYLSQEDYNKLKQKAYECGFNGRGSLGHFLSKLANEPIVFLDSNIKNLLEALRLKPGVK